MQAMILAAGKGTRLQPLTDSCPKALVPIKGKSALEWTIQRLYQVGIRSIIINTHYLSDQIAAFVEQYDSLPVTLTLSYESKLLDTGGGLLQTHSFWEDSSFILHNVDIFSSADLLEAYHTHKTQNNLVTLLTQDRPTQTKLLIDEEDFFCGIHYYRTEIRKEVRSPKGQLHEQGFCGMHILSSNIFSQISESGAFSIIDCYLRLSQEGQAIRTFDIGQAYWKDMGTPDLLKTLENDWNASEKLQSAYQIEASQSY